MPTNTTSMNSSFGDQPAVDTRNPVNPPTTPDRNLLSLEESEARYRRLFETAKDGILILDGDTGRITDVNPFLQDMLGYSKSELVGKALWEIGPVENIAASQESMRNLQNSAYIRYDDLPLETKSGGRKQVEFVSNVYLVNGWRVIQCNIRDITERKQAEARAKAATLELVVLVDELQWRDREMQLLNRMNDLLLSCMTMEEAYQVISLMGGELFPGYDGCLSIMRPKDRLLDPVANWGGDRLEQVEFAMDDCWALRLGKVHEVSDPQNGLLCRHFHQPPTAGYLCLPLTVHGEILGLLSLTESAERKDTHQPSVQQSAVYAAETIKLSLSNLKLRDELRRLAIQDPLTGLFNRRYLDENLPRELHIARRRNSPLSIVMLDIDGFKKINDTFGHGAGDAVLRGVGNILRDHLRKSDISCRYGGDEFVLVLPDSSITDTQERIEQICELVRTLKINADHASGIVITVSAGIALAPEHGATESELLRAADEAMYTAKQTGGDRISIHLPRIASNDFPQPG